MNIPTIFQWIIKWIDLLIVYKRRYRALLLNLMQLLWRSESNDTCSAIYNFCFIDSDSRQRISLCVSVFEWWADNATFIQLNCLCAGWLTSISDLKTLLSIRKKSRNSDACPINNSSNGACPARNTNRYMRRQSRNIWGFDDIVEQKKAMHIKLAYLYRERRFICITNRSELSGDLFCRRWKTVYDGFRNCENVTAKYLIRFHLKMACQFARFRIPISKH